MGTADMYHTCRSLHTMNVDIFSSRCKLARLAEVANALVAMLLATTISVGRGRGGGESRIVGEQVGVSVGLRRGGDKSAASFGQMTPMVVGAWFDTTSISGMVGVSVIDGINPANISGRWGVGENVGNDTTGIIWQRGEVRADGVDTSSISVQPRLGGSVGMGVDVGGRSRDRGVGVVVVASRHRNQAVGNRRGVTRLMNLESLTVR